MKCDIFVTDFFAKKLKKLSKKYSRIKEDFSDLVTVLETDPCSGDRLKGCEAIVCKIRMASRDMQKGKSGGFRVIYMLQENGRRVDLLTVYAKNDAETISITEVNTMLGKLGYV